MNYPVLFTHFLRAAALVVPMITLFGQSSLELKVSPEVAGYTPKVLGYNMGHLVPGSNSHDWFSYTEVNGFRVWSTPPHIAPTDGTGSAADRVDSWESLLTRRAALRADPLNQEYINWDMFNANFESVMQGTNRLSIKNVLELSKERNLTPLVMIHRGLGRYPFRDSANKLDWTSRWHTWQHYYAQAFWMARHFDVERFQIYNEPDHRINARLPQEEYIERLKISSDAVQAALEDVNRLYDKDLRPRISAPVTVAGITMFHPRPDRQDPDRRDSETGWGELAMKHRSDAMFPDVAEDFSNFQVYAYQQYGRDGPGYAEQYRGMRELVAEANDGEPLPVIITEFNVLANYMFRRTEDTMHTPSRAARLGSILLNLIEEQPDELYVFKFGQTKHDTESYLAKNGNFWQDNNLPPFHTGGSTRGAEVYRLVMRTFQKNRQLLEQPKWIGKTPDAIWSSATFDPGTEMYHLLIVSEESEGSRSLQIDFKDWGIATPGLAILEEVSLLRHGAVRGLVQIPADKKLELEMDPESTWLLSIPKEAFGFAMANVVEDAHVQAGRARDKNFGKERIMKVSGHPSRAANRNAAFLKFDTSELSVGDARRILLRLHVRNTQEREILPAHVYGLTDSSWAENTITADNSPSLRLHGGNMREIGDNRVSGQGESTFIQGTITATSHAQDVFVDVTNFVKKHMATPVFMITQENRFSGELNAYRGEMEILSRESGQQYSPQLILLY